MKGGMLIAALVGIDNRSTMDLDTTLRNLSLTQENVIKTITEICAIELDDEVIFIVKKTEPIRKDDIYGGLRVSIDAVYDTIVTPLLIDVSTGDAITPSPVKYKFSGIFDETKEIELWAYNIETVLAEKVETILRRGELNTRPRDFYDIHILCTTQKYDSEIFKNAFWATAEHRGSAELIRDVHSIVENIKTSTLLQNSWKRYAKEYLNENNYQAPKSKHWSKNTVLGMLRNEAYIGTTVFNKRAPVGSGKKYNDESEWVIVENTHTPIISKEDFETVQAMMHKRKKQNGENNIARNLTSLDPLSGLVFCEHCHSLYLPTTGSSKKRGKIHYYGCGARRRNGKSVCSTHLIPAELLEKFVLYRMREILTSSMYKEQFEMQLTRELEILQSKKKDITKLKKDIAKITTQKNKLLDLMLTEENEELVKTYKEKLEDIIAQLSINNDQLKLYESIDISEEEREIRKQFNKSHEDITYKDFQELSREQLKVFFNYMIDHIDIRELENIGNDPKVYLAITIHLKLNGYAPKYSIEYLKNIRTEEKQKASHFKNDLPNGGGEGGI